MSIKIENAVLPSNEQWEAIIRGMRNPKNSWDLSDSTVCDIDTYGDCMGCDACTGDAIDGNFVVGPKDHKLMSSLAKGGPVHAKYRRMIPVFLDITAPLYWWKEFDTYKVGTVANSCSTMHKIHDKEFTLEDFSCEHLWNVDQSIEDYISEHMDKNESCWGVQNPKHVLNIIIGTLNYYREQFLKSGDKKDWWQMIQLLPSSYNQKRTVMLNYEVLVGMYKWRKNHKLDEWHMFCDWIESLPYSELITGEEKVGD